MPIVVYKKKGISVGSSGVVWLGWVKAGSGADFKVRAIGASYVGGITNTDPPASFEVHVLSSDGTGTGSLTGVMANGTSSYSPASSGEYGPFSGAPTSAGEIGGVPLRTGDTYFYRWPKGEEPIIKAGSRVGVAIDRNSSTGTGTATFMVEIEEPI